MFFYYLGKFNNSNLLQILKKMQTRKFNFLNTLCFVAHNLHTYCLLWFLVRFKAATTRDARGTVSEEFFGFQHDNAPAHRGRDTVPLLEQATPAFIKPDLWPANSPDLNPVAYRIWSVVQQRRRVYQSRVHDTDELKQRLQQVWRNVDQSIIDNAIDEWRKRLRTCVQCAGEL